MILGFKTHFPNGKPTYFVEQIWAAVWLEYSEGYPVKMHSIRKGKRWRKGMSIQMATGVRTKDYNQFNFGFRELSTVVSVQDIKIKWRHGKKTDTNFDFEVFVDGRKLSPLERRQLMHNDGFPNAYDFQDWFNSDFEGQIIHWTNLHY